MGCPKLVNRSQSLVGRSSLYCEDMWRTHCCLTSFYPIVDTCLSCEDIARQNCAMVTRWPFLATFCVLYFQRAACSTFQIEPCAVMNIYPHPSLMMLMLLGSRESHEQLVQVSATTGTCSPIRKKVSHGVGVITLHQSPNMAVETHGTQFSINHACK